MKKVEIKVRKGRRIQGKTEFARLLKEKGLSIKEFCEKWGIKYQTAKFWSNGHSPAPEVILNILRRMEYFTDCKS